MRSLREGGCAKQRSDLSFALNQIELLTTVSQAYFHLAGHLLCLRTAPIVIPNFVETEVFRPTRKSIQSMAIRRIRLIHVSNFRPVKDPVAVARLFEAIHPRVNCELWLVGNGQGLQKTRAYLREAGLMSHVRCFGFRDDVHRILPEADILLMPSKEESFCLAALEAMSCGLPVVATRVGGLRELIEHEASGYLFDPEDSREGVRFIERLSSDPGLYFSVRHSAIRRAGAFEARRNVAQYEKQYRKLLAGRHPPRVVSRAPAPMAE